MDTIDTLPRVTEKLYATRPKNRDHVTVTKRNKKKRL